MGKDLAFNLRNKVCQLAALAAAIRDAAVALPGVDQQLEKFQALAIVAEEKADEGLAVVEQLLGLLDALPA